MAEYNELESVQNSVNFYEGVLSRERSGRVINTGIFLSGVIMAGAGIGLLSAGEGAGIVGVFGGALLGWIGADSFVEEARAADNAREWVEVYRQDLARLTAEDSAPLQ